MKINKAASIPLVLHDPFFSIWSGADRLYDKDTVHWSTFRQKLYGCIRIDEKEYSFMGVEEENEAIPIGHALSNCDVKLVVEGHCENAVNVVGEIYVASPALAECYYGDETKTASSFTVNDFGDGKKRYYHTGDMAKYDESGNLVFVTRSDSQIKHMGHRIELGEIETVATSIEGVDKCCCLYDNKKSRIMLYVQLEQGVELTQAELRKQLKQRLSDYMVPHRIKCMDKLPINANGKVDRVLLKQELN